MELHVLLISGNGRMFLPAQNIGERVDAQFANVCTCGGRNCLHLQRKLERCLSLVGFLA